MKLTECEIEKIECILDRLELLLKHKDDISKLENEDTKKFADDNCNIVVRGWAGVCDAADMLYTSIYITYNDSLSAYLGKSFLLKRKDTEHHPIFPVAHVDGTTVWSNPNRWAYVEHCIKALKKLLKGRLMKF